MPALEVTRHEIPSTLSKRPSSAAVARRLSLEQMCQYCLMKLNGHCHEEHCSERPLCSFNSPNIKCWHINGFKFSGRKIGNTDVFVMWDVSNTGRLDKQMSNSVIIMLHSVASDKHSTCY